jgi:glycine/D-amino acid oxidase-like deaminating enzyme
MGNPILDSADVVVVGAGIAGITTAFELRAKGYDVVVVEQRFPAYGASGRSAGSIWLQTCAAGDELELARSGRDRYAQYIEELGNTFGYRQCGGLFFFETEAQGAALEDYVKDRRAAGLEVSLIDAQEARSLTSLLPDTAIGAVHCADDAQVDATRFVQAVSDACVRRGVRVYENTSVLTAVRQGEAVVGVRTTRGDIRTPALIWATGAWALNLNTEGIDLPLSTARQGQILTQALPPQEAPLMRGPRGVVWASALTQLPSYSSDVFQGPSEEHTGASVRYDDTVSQNGEGGLFIGSSLDEPGALNPHIGLAGTHAMLGAALERYPQQSSLGIIGLWAGVASWVEDQLPIIDRVDGVYVNVGHARGVATGPIGGQIAAACIAGESHRFTDAISAARFPSHLQRPSQNVLS